MHKVGSLTEAVKRAAASAASLTDAVKEAAREPARQPGAEAAANAVDRRAERPAPGYPANPLDGRHDGSQGGRHPWGPPPADGRSERRPRFEYKFHPRPREPERSPWTAPEAAPADPDPSSGARSMAIRLADPAHRFLASGARLAAIALVSVFSLVVAPTVVGPDRPASVATPPMRVALVIGNSAYRHTRRLESPKNDAADIGIALERHGFQVIRGFDLDKTALEAKIRDFEGALKGANVGAFFYAGHGLQVSGQTYLVPVDAELATASALELELVRLDPIRRAMEREAETRLLFLDAGRDNPLSDNLARALGARSADIGRGLGAASGGAGTLVSLSAQPGKLARDGKGRNSPYSAALVRQLVSSKEDLAGMLIAVRNEVMRETDSRQVPWEYAALTGRFYFDPDGARQAPAPAAQAAAHEAFEAWSAARDTTSIGVLDAYIARYGDTFYATLARARIEDLKKFDETSLSSPVRGPALQR
jgi:uncharacterized caspase-like protein